MVLDDNYSDIYSIKSAHCRKNSPSKSVYDEPVGVAPPDELLLHLEELLLCFSYSCRGFGYSRSRKNS
jgi:hypothetical protein